MKEVMPVLASRDPKEEGGYPGICLLVPWWVVYPVICLPVPFRPPSMTSTLRVDVTLVYTVRVDGFTLLIRMLERGGSGRREDGFSPLRK